MSNYFDPFEIALNSDEMRKTLKAVRMRDDRKAKKMASKSQEPIQAGKSKPKASSLGNSAFRARG